MKQKKLSWLIAGLFSMPAASVMAQETPAAPAAEAVQSVTVTGIRASVRSALVAKEASNSIVEVIASEDIGKLPDTTIAESLARLPGLSSGLDRGNASQVVARGMGPRFVGATLNGREIASSEPARAVRFEQFPSESLSGAMVHKTQSAELIEGGIATSIDLTTVKPLSYKGRQINLKADALYYALGREIPDAPTVKPRVGGIYLDQFLDKTVGVALAFSYQKQPSLAKRTKHWDFNDATNSQDVTGDGVVDKTPWGFEQEAKRGTYERSSVLGKVEWKPSSDLLVTGDVYYAESDIKEPAVSHWYENMGNWGGGRSADYRNEDIRDGYVVGGTIDNQTVTSNSTLWTQVMDVFATGVNAKFNAGDWKLEADLSGSKGGRDSQWRDLRMYGSTPGTLNWAFTGNSNTSLSFNQDTGNAATFGGHEMRIDTDGHLEDEMAALAFNAMRPIGWGDVSRIKVGARFTDREKTFHQTTWQLSPTSAIPASAFETVKVDGIDRPFLALKDFENASAQYFGAGVFSPAGRSGNENDVLAGWKVTEKSSAIYAQAELEGNMFGKTYRGNVGVRVVDTKQTGSGVQRQDGIESPFTGGTSYTEVLPSMNLIFNMDEAQEQQLRFSLARAMARTPLDEVRGSRNLNLNSDDLNRPITGSAGNPELKPMLADQLDLAYQWYFAKGSLLSGGVFYKDVSRYITIVQDDTTIGGRPAQITRSVNGNGGYVRGLELVYQQLYDNGIGLSTNYSYSESNIKESIPTGNPFPMEGLMKHNGGFTVWYEKDGFEARLSANYHSPFVRNPTWGAGGLTVNEEETYVTLGMSKQITPNITLRFGMDNVTDQKTTYTSAGNKYNQEVFNFGRRYNLGVSFKL